MEDFLKDEHARISYALGINVAEYLGGMPLAPDMKLVMAAMQDMQTGQAKLSPEEYQAAMQLCQEKMRSAAQTRAAEAGARMKAEGDAFLAENGKKAGVRTTASGLQYEVISEGSGKRPSAADTVRVHYTGKLLDGKVFDSSVSRGEPAEFGLAQVISGWTEGLQLMTEGSKYRFYIPPQLAYGEHGAGNSIPPMATLIFDVELLAIL